MNETRTQLLLRNAIKSLDYCRKQEDELRKALAMATDSTRKAKEKYHMLFLKEEEETIARIKSEYTYKIAVSYY